MKSVLLVLPVLFVPAFGAASEPAENTTNPQLFAIIVNDPLPLRKYAEYLRATKKRALLLPEEDETNLLQATALEIATLNLKEESGRETLWALSKDVYEVRSKRLESVRERSATVDLQAHLMSCVSVAPDSPLWEGICRSALARDGVLQSSWETLPNVERSAESTLKWLHAAARVGNAGLFRFLLAKVSEPLDWKAFEGLVRDSCASGSIDFYDALKDEALKHLPDLVDEEEFVTSALHIAAAEGNVEMFWKMRRLHPNIDSIIPSLIDAAMEGGSWKIVVGLADGSDLPAVLLKLVQNGQADILERFLWSSETDEPQDHVLTALPLSFFPQALETATKLGHVSVVNLLLRHRDETLVWPLGDLDDVVNDVLMIAAQEGQAAIVEYIFGEDEGGQLRFPTILVESDVLLAAVTTRQLAVVRVLGELKKAGDERVEGMNFRAFNNRPIHIACSNGDLEMVRYFDELKATGNLNFILMRASDRRYAALVQAAIKGHSKVLEFLLQDAKSLMPVGKTTAKLQAALKRAFLGAAKAGKAESVQCLLDSRRRENVVNFREQALQKAVGGKHEATVNVLLNDGTPVSAALLKDACQNSTEVIVSQLATAIPDEEFKALVAETMNEKGSWLGRIWGFLIGKRPSSEEFLKNKAILKRFFVAHYGAVPDDEDLLNKMVEEVSRPDVDVKKTAERLSKDVRLVEWEKKIVERSPLPSYARTVLYSVITGVLLGKLLGVTRDQTLLLPAANGNAGALPLPPTVPPTGSGNSSTPLVDPPQGPPTANSTALVSLDQCTPLVPGNGTGVSSCPSGNGAYNLLGYKANTPASAMPNHVTPFQNNEMPPFPWITRANNGVPSMTDRFMSPVNNEVLTLPSGREVVLPSVQQSALDHQLPVDMPERLPEVPDLIDSHPLLYQESVDIGNPVSAPDGWTPQPLQDPSAIAAYPLLDPLSYPFNRGARDFYTPVPNVDNAVPEFSNTSLVLTPP